MYIIFNVKHRDTHVCGWVGSSPRETVSPWISLKHFSQKWYLSAISPNFGELHQSPQHSQSQTAHGRAVTIWYRTRARQGATNEANGSSSAGQQEVVIATASHDFEGWGGGMGWEVDDWSRQKQANVDITGREDRQVAWTRSKTRQTQQRAKAKHRLAIWTWQHEQQQPPSQLTEQEQNQWELNGKRELEHELGAEDLLQTLNNYEQISTANCSDVQTSSSF